MNEALEAGSGAQGPLEAGSLIAERYRLVRPIGSGGMGSVWEAEHLVLGSRVAVKLMSPQLVEDERARARFQREAQAAANLRGPHVVDIFDHGVHLGTPYIAMELLEGESLSTRLAARRRLAPADVAELVAQIGRAIAKAHAAGVIHRDLKPENIFLVPGEHAEIAKVLDFGIAKRTIEPLAGATTGCGALLGSPFYMSPEQLVDAALADARADLWSLAVITYECLLGRRPFSANSMAELAVAVLAEPIPVPSQHGEVPPGFDAWFAKATSRDPDARFQDALEMTDALALALAPAATQPSALPTARPRRSAAIVLVPTLFAAIALAGLALARDREHDTTPTPVAPAASSELPAPAQPTAPPPTTKAPTAPASTTPTSVPTPTAELAEPASTRRTPARTRKPIPRANEGEPKPPRQDPRELEGI